MSDPEFDRYLRDYSAQIEKSLGPLGNTHDFFTRNKAEILLPAFATLGKTANLKVLDVGCGIGLVHPYIVEAVGELHGADMSGASIEVARRDNPAVQYETYDGIRLPYPDGSFDCAFAICVLHHVPVAQWPSFLADMRRVVRPGGLVLFIEHNPLNPATLHVVRTCQFDANAVLIKPWTLRRLMASAGIGGIWTKYVLFTPFAGKAFRLLDRALSAVPFGAQYAMGGTVGPATEARSASKSS